MASKMVLTVMSLAVLASPAAVAAQAPIRDSVPADLRRLLAPRRSEMRLVSLRYSADRNLLVGNYAGSATAGIPVLNRRARSSITIVEIDGNARGRSLVWQSLNHRTEEPRAWTRYRE